MAEKVFASIGIDFKSAAEDIRDKVVFTDESALSFRNRLAEKGVAQSVILSTCNRVEVFCCAQEGELPEVEKLLLSDFPMLEKKYIHSYCGFDGIVRLFRIAAGFESMIFGEYQILGQLKDAYAESLASHHAQGELDKVMRDAISCAKEVRTELDLGATPPSVCLAGMRCIENAVGIAGKSVFVIGSGRTGTLAVKIAAEMGAKSIAVCNRDSARARHLVEKYGAEIVEYTSRYDVIEKSDIVISATASPHIVVEERKVRLNGKTVILDLASPRDVEPSIGRCEGVTLFSIDTIGELAEGNAAERERLSRGGMEKILLSAKVTEEAIKEYGRRMQCQE
jgi:glutamyl-tRNA reductase